MSKLAHSNDATMREIERRRVVEEEGEAFAAELDRLTDLSPSNGTTEDRDNAHP